MYVWSTKPSLTSGLTSNEGGGARAVICFRMDMATERSTSLRILRSSFHCFVRAMVISQLSERAATTSGMSRLLPSRRTCATMPVVAASDNSTWR